jgi:hypothetical protein
MTYFNNLNRLIIWFSISGLALPVLAHKVKTSNEIGATIHVEPADRARTNEQTVIWFALTRKGGQTVPLRDCQCQLQVLQLPSKQAVMQPGLQPINAEKYQGIPSATVLFQQPGAYLLELSGQPQAGANFQPFKLQFDLTVAPGKPTTASADSTRGDEYVSSPELNKIKSPLDSVPAPINWLLYVGAVAGLAGSIALIVMFTRPKK